MFKLFLCALIKANFLKSSFALSREASLNQLTTSRPLFHFCKKSEKANVPPDKLSKYTQSFKTTIEKAVKKNAEAKLNRTSSLKLITQVTAIL